MQAPATATPAATPAVDDGSRWRARPAAALTVRILIALVPIAASITASFVVAREWRRPPGLLAGAGWWSVMIATGTVTLIVVDRAARRFLPLSTLLRMSLTFPDEKPSRFGLALRTGTTKQLEARLDDVRANGLGATEREAAETLLKLVAALREHDRLTRGHGERVRAYSALIGEQLGLDEDDLSKLQWAGLIHDVGKLAVPSEILTKPGRLTDEEFDIVKTHPAEGMAMVGPLAGWLGDWVLAVGEHHERWDGRGYPNGLAGHDISLAGRIVAVADVFDVITAARSYKTPQTPHEAREELARNAGTQFDPDVVRAFLQVSIDDLRKSVMPMSWAAQLPVIGALSGQAAGFLAPVALAFGTALTGGGLAAAAAADGSPQIDGDLVDELPAAGPILGSDDDNIEPLGTTLPGDPAPGDAPDTPATGTTLPKGEPSTGTTTPTTVPGSPPETTLPSLPGAGTTVPGLLPTVPTLPVSTTVPGLLPTVPTLPVSTTVPGSVLPTLPVTTTLPDLIPTTLPDVTVPPLPTTLPTVPTLPTTLPTVSTLPPTTLPPLPTTLPPLPTTLPTLPPTTLAPLSTTTLPPLP